MRPSVEAMTSCGSGPEGTFPSTFSVVGSTTDSVRSPLDNTSNLPEDEGDDWAAPSATVAADSTTRIDLTFITPPDFGFITSAVGFWALVNRSSTRSSFNRGASQLRLTARVPFARPSDKAVRAGGWLTLQR